MRKPRARAGRLKKLPRAPGGNCAQEGACPRHDRNLVRRRGPHRPEEQDHPPLGQARHPSKRTAGPTDRFHLHLRCSLPEGGQGCSPDHAGLQHRGDELAPRRDRRNRCARCPRHPPGRSSRLALVHAPPRAGQHHHHSAAAEVPRAQPGRERLAVHARQLALQPHLQILRRSRRPLLCGMEQARRSALAHHVHRTAPMGPRVLINGIWYKLAPSFPFPSEALVQRAPAESTTGSSDAAAAATIYAVAFVTGAIVMSFEMLGSRYLNPYFGSGIYTWAALISTVLIALMAGYFLGGMLADRTASPAVLALTVIIGSLYLLALPSFAQAILEFVLAGVDDIRAGSLISSLALMFFPVTFLGMYSPFAIRLLLRSAQRSGRVSGAVYGISTAGAIVGTLGTTFLLIPTIGARAITLTLGALGLAAGLALMALARLDRRAGAALVVIALAALAVPAGRADNLIDEGVRVAMLERADGQLAHIETPYNDVFITKRQHQLVMSFQLKGWDYTESVSNLLDPDDLPLRYAQVMTVATIYPEAPRKILMLGLGGGSISTYLGRFMPEAAITTVEIDPDVITAAKTYFGLRETERMRYHAGDGRVFLNRNSELYDLILLDAYRGGYVPFHLLTREFYTLVKQRLTPGGAAAFNVHDGSKLYASTVKTLGEVFAALDLYPTSVGEVIAVARTSPLDPQTLERRAAALQQRHGFRFPLPQILQRRMDKPQSQAANGDVITDDFAPADVYDVMGKDPRRRR